MLPAVRADEVTVDVCADVGIGRSRRRAREVRADDAPIGVRKAVISDVCNVDDFALTGKVLVPGAVIRFIDRDMAIRIFTVAAVDQNVALLRLCVL